MNPTRRDTPFREAMRSLLVFDGAMGSLLYERGVFVTQNFEQLNVTRPDVVRKIHEDYIAAGAQVVETNTFGANSFCLDRHGLGDQVRAYNLAGARLARTAAGEDAWVAGSIGPTGLVPGVATRAELDQVAATFAEQATTLAEGGVDLFVLETFRHLEEIRIAIEAARRAAPGLPIIASMTFDASETVADGSTPEQVATTLRDWGADGIGVNCGDGPQLALAIAERLRGAGLPLSVQPNAGLPRTVDGRLLYMATPEYLDVFARRTIQLGATMVGGCCGTTPDHVRWMAKSSRMLGDKHTEVVRNRPITAAEVVPILEPTPLAERSDFAAKLAAGSSWSRSRSIPRPGSIRRRRSKAPRCSWPAAWISSTWPTRRARWRACRTWPSARCCSSATGSSRSCTCAGATGISWARWRTCSAPTPSASATWSSSPATRPRSATIPRPPRCTTSTRSVCSRWPPNMNRGIDPAGKPLPGGQTSFLLATGLEPGAADLDKEIRRLERKKVAGAEIVMTQPIFQTELLERVLQRIAPLQLPVMVGVLPLVSYKNAEFLHNEVPGMQIPAEIRERMRKTPGGEAARKEGVKIAREMLFAVRDRVQGAYLMPPLGRYELALEVLDGLKR